VCAVEAWLGVRWTSCFPCGRVEDCGKSVVDGSSLNGFNRYLVGGVVVVQ